MGRTLNRGSLFSVPSAVEVLCEAFLIPFPLVTHPPLPGPTTPDSIPSPPHLVLTPQGRLERWLGKAGDACVAIFFQHRQDEDEWEPLAAFPTPLRPS